MLSHKFEIAKNWAEFLHNEAKRQLYPHIDWTFRSYQKKDYIYKDKKMKELLQKVPKKLQSKGADFINNLNPYRYWV